MPRIHGLNVIGVLVSAIAFFFLGFLVYGVIFAEMWTGAMGIEADMEAGPVPLELLKGFSISLVTAIFLGLALQKTGVEGLFPSIRMAAFLWLGFAVTTLAYGLVYTGYPLSVFALDCGHLLAGFVLVVAIQTLMDGVAVKP